MNQNNFVFKAGIIVIAIMVITYSKTYIISAQELNSSWSAFRHDSLNTGRSTLQGPENNNLKWSFETGGSVDSSPVLDHNGTIYIGSQDKKFHAIKPDGTLEWSYDIGSKIYSTPAIDINNIIYVCAWNGKLFALDLEGKPRWSVQIKGRIASSPAISAKGNIFVCSDNYYLYKVNPAGRILWAFATHKYVDSSPAIDDNESTVYFGSTPIFIQI